MHVRWPARRSVRELTVPLVTATALIGLGPGTAPASACVGWTVLNPPHPGSANTLNGVAVVSSSRAWAAGEYNNSRGGTQTLLVHWNGTTWQQVPSPNPSTFFAELDGVAAVSATNAWTVGTTGQTLIAHWNGTTWQQVPSPNPGGSSGSNFLFGVAATSASNAWAVGENQDSAGTHAIALRQC